MREKIMAENMIENNITAVKDICFLIFNILARFDLMVYIKTYGFVSYYAECSKPIKVFSLRQTWGTV